MDSVLLAGGRCPEDVKAATGCELRAALPIGGKPMVQWVAESLPEGRRIVVGYEITGYEHARAGNSFVESLKNGLEMVSGESFLLAAGDLPFLRRESVERFLRTCDAQVAINFPIIPVDATDKAFPGMKRTALKLREGRFTGGNIALCNTALMRRIFPVLEQAYANRKKPLKLAMQVGVGTLLRVAVGQLVPATLSLRGLEQRVGRFLGAPVRAIAIDAPEIGADIDSLEQYHLAVKMLESGNRP